jgi:hypothetical protein
LRAKRSGKRDDEGDDQNGDGDEQTLGAQRSTSPIW